MIQNIIACASLLITSFIPFPTSHTRQLNHQQRNDVTSLSRTINRERISITERGIIVGVVISTVTQNPNFFIMTPAKFIFNNFLRFFQAARNDTRPADVENLIDIEEMEELPVVGRNVRAMNAFI